MSEANGVERLADALAVGVSPQRNSVSERSEHRDRPTRHRRLWPWRPAVQPAPCPGCCAATATPSSQPAALDHRRRVANVSAVTVAIHILHRMIQSGHHQQVVDHHGSSTSTRFPTVPQGESRRERRGGRYSCWRVMGLGGGMVWWSWPFGCQSLSERSGLILRVQPWSWMRWCQSVEIGRRLSRWVWPPSS